jgi:hypothetical protein
MIHTEAQKMAAAPPPPDASPPALDPTAALIGLWARRILKPVASLKVTVVLFVFSMLLVFFGTLAQVYLGIWTVVEDYFWSVVAWVPLQLLVVFGQKFLWFPEEWRIDSSWRFPLPGGYTLGWLLFINLLAAHALRFKLSWKRAGIILTHSGLILMLAGEFITREFAVEGHMSIFIGETSSLIIDQRKSELAVIDSSGPTSDVVTVVPGRNLRPGRTIQDDKLPFAVEVLKYFGNSEIADKLPRQTEADDAAGTGPFAVRQPPTNGLSDKLDIPSAYVKLTDKSGADLGTYLVSVHFSDAEGRPPQKVKVGGKTYGIALRFKRAYEPFSIHLKNFKHEVYPGTDVPKNFQSDVQLIDPEMQIDRAVTIKMNQPMRHRGQAFYQSGVLPGDKGTVLQVVRNPGWFLPYLSCFVVALGMMVHFGMTLVNFLARNDVAREKWRWIVHGVSAAAKLILGTS